jgi:hypothetical protein
MIWRSRCLLDYDQSGLDRDFLLDHSAHSLNTHPHLDSMTIRQAYLSYVYRPPFRMESSFVNDPYRIVLDRAPADIQEDRWTNKMYL